MTIKDLIAAVLLEASIPSRPDQTPFAWGQSQIGHALLGAMLGTPIVLLGLWASFPTAALFALSALSVGPAYYVLKERGDLTRGGGRADGISDTIYVAWGAGAVALGLAFVPLVWGAVALFVK